jgi:hypothetical protein
VGVGKRETEREREREKAAGNEKRPPWPTALPDGGFLRQICKIRADLKVIWQAKNISGGLPISGGFDQFFLGWFFSGGFWQFWSLYEQKTTCFSLILAEKKLLKKNKL